MDSEITTRIRDNLAEVRQRIVEAAGRSGRTAGDVRLVAVTKYVDADITRELVRAGCADLGESRPQVLWAKAAELGRDVTAEQHVRWHMIGHLQRNKLRRTLPLITLLHSADSLRLIDEVEQQAAGLARPLDALIEVNVSGDDEKHGFKPEEVQYVVAQLGEYQLVKFRGLMCMG
ncbi:MAG: alanine racemase, partial [Planctomycetales bacterium]|nr:alanine racemase [Planctomycetales bacterium]